MTNAATARRRAAWEELTTPSGPPQAFDPATIVDLPDPARRLLERSIRPGSGLNPTVILRMVGEIKLKRWMPFRARQVIRVGEGFVWEATVGRPPVVFAGGDTLCRGQGCLDFRLWGVVPVARSAGSDVDRSAEGRLAAEMVAWAPQALAPQMGATWNGIDETQATVSLPIGHRRVDVTVAIDEVGRLNEITMERWGNPGSKVYELHRFGAAVAATGDVGGVTIASSGTVGWWWGTERQAHGEFFRYRLETDQPGSTTDGVRV